MNRRNHTKTPLPPVFLKIGAVSLVIGLLPLLAAAQTMRLPSGSTTIRGTTTAPSTTTVTAPAATINTAPVVGSATVSPTTITNTGVAPAVINQAALRSAPTTTTVMTAATISQPTTVASPSILRYDTMPASVVSAPTTQPAPTNTTYVAVLPEPCPWTAYINIFNYQQMSGCRAGGTMPTTTLTPSVYTPPATTTSPTRTTTAPASEQLTASLLTPCRTLDYMNVLAYRTLTNCYGSGFQEIATSAATAPTPISETVTRVTTFPVGSTGTAFSLSDVRTAAISAATVPIGVAQPSAQGAAPVISNIRATNVSAQSATISWDTDRSTSGFIDFGATSMYGKTQVSSSGAISHQAVLSDFLEQGGSTFHFRVRVRDAQGVESVSADQVVQIASVVAAKAAAAGSASASAPEISAPQLTVETVMKGLQNLTTTTTRLLTPEEKAALGFPFRATVQVQTITSRGLSRTVFNYTNVAEQDTDSDGLPDKLEEQLGTNKNYEDTDGDGKSDGYEYYTSKTDPKKAD